MTPRRHLCHLFVSAGFLAAVSGCLSPLHKAAQQGREKEVAFLLDQGRDVDSTTSEGMTPLMWAAYFGREETVRFLLDRGASVNALDRRKRSALWYAAVDGDLGTVKLLHQRGADLKMVDILGKGPAQSAQERGQVQVVSYLSEAGAGVSPTILRAAVAEAVEEAGFGKLSRKPARVSDVDVPKRQFAERPQDFALIVGVERYKSLPDADYAARDAEAVRRHLQALGFPRRNIIYLIGQNATRAAVESYVEEWLPRNASKESTVLIYFAGHGSSDLSTGETYLVPWDGDPMFLKSSAYATKRLYAQAAGLPVRDALIVLDACFSGGGGRSVLPQGARPLVTRVEEEVGAENTALFAAASGNEITGALDEQGHGLFTYYFLKGLSGEAVDPAGNLSAEGLYWYLKPLVQGEARRQNREQTPLLVGRRTTQVFFNLK